MLFNLMYEFLLWMLALIYAPKFLYLLFFKKKYQESIKSRFGKNFPIIDKKGKPLIWIHAVSVGETKAIAPLAKMIRSNTPNAIILISSITETGHAEAKRSLPFADYHVYLPLDFNRIIKPIVKMCSPDLVILTETDFWYNFLRASKECGATVIVANGKMSERSQQRLIRFPIFAKKLFSLVDLFCIQGTIYKNRFEEVGVPSEKMLVTGNLKFDEEYPTLSQKELSDWKDLLGIGPDNQILVIGSSHNPEEKVLLDVIQGIWKRHPNLKAILVPRHPERFNEVATLLEVEKIPFVRYTKLDEKTGKEKVVLMDSMGLLRKCYQIADLAIVAGSYTDRVGGHNILEPSWYGVPVLYGPHMHTQPDLVLLSQEYRSGLQIDVPELAETIDRLLTSSEDRSQFKQGAAQLLKNCNGATDRTWQAIKKLKINSF